MKTLFDIERETRNLLLSQFGGFAAVNYNDFINKAHPDETYKIIEGYFYIPVNNLSSFLKKSTKLIRAA